MGVHGPVMVRGSCKQPAKPLTLSSGELSGLSAAYKVLGMLSINTISGS